MTQRVSLAQSGVGRFIAAGLTVCLGGLFADCSKIGAAREAKKAAAASGLAAADTARGPALPKDAGERAMMTIRRLEIAQKFRQEPPENPQLARGKLHKCEHDGNTLEPLLVTTYGAMGDPAVWRAYPLALEAWRCPKCQSVLYPAFLESKEAMALLDEGVAAGRAGKLDEAEFALRRVVGSWSNFAPARMNLGSVYLDRARQAEKNGAPAEEITRYRKTAIEQLEKALKGEPPPQAQVRFMLGYAYMELGDRDRGREHLRAYLAAPGGEEPYLSGARRLLAE